MNGSNAFDWFMENIFSWVALVAVGLLSLATLAVICALVFFGFSEFFA